MSIQMFACRGCEDVTSSLTRRSFGFQLYLHIKHLKDTDFHIIQKTNNYYIELLELLNKIILT